MNIKIPLTHHQFSPTNPHSCSSPFYSPFILFRIMECIEARALKSSFLSQMGMMKANNNNNSQVLYNDDVWCFNSVLGGSDDFPVEELLNLDFSEKEFEEYDEEKVSEKGNSDNNSSSNFSDEFDSLSAGELAVPVDELENLEWLSQFVDDSSTGLSLLCPVSVKTGGTPANRVEPVRKPIKRTRAPCFPLPVPVKPRSKRSRSNGCRWSMSLTSADSSSTTSSSHGSSTLSPFVFMNPVHDAEWFSSIEKPVAKKLKRKTEESGLVTGRRCTHCQVNRTPQWRTGPLGPKTLCNACGVRFKSGRLFPEYRPACSPTFSQDLHSNSHRKVLEMRRKTEDKTEPASV